MQENALKPSCVWHYFKEICKVPRPSGKTEKIQAWLINFAKEHNFEYVHDEIGNVIIRKPATPGMENATPVILQGHIDMVCEKNGDVHHDFENDPIDWYITDDGWMAARGTTLGADNGIGLALSLAALTDENIKHGPLECLFTVDEETGLYGADALKPGVLKGKALINLDNEDDGYICIGCCGGINTKATFDYTLTDAPEDYFFFTLGVKGLQGGHSGSDINLGRGNANRLLVRFLYDINNSVPLYLVDFKGGNLSNAIPREAVCVAAVPFSFKEELRVRLNLFEADLKAEIGKVEPNMEWYLESTAINKKVIDKKQSDAFLAAMNVCPDGVIAMSNSVEGLVETSTNLAAVKPTGPNQWTIVTSQRSSFESAKNALVNRIDATFKLAGMTVNHTSGYPGWAPNPDSPLLAKMVEAYRGLYNEDPIVYAIHAGLECGLFLEKYPDLDMVSYGPTMTGVHSPDEKVLISTVGKAWDWLVAVLERV